MQDVLRFIRSAFILSGILFWSKLHWRRNISKLHGLFVMRRPGLCRAPCYEQWILFFILLWPEIF